MVPRCEHTSKALRYTTHSQEISQFYLHTLRSSTNGMNHTCRLIPSWSWSLFSIPVWWKAELAWRLVTYQNNIAYVSPVEELIESNGVSYHQFADDTQLLVAMNVTYAGPALEKLANCSTTVRLWFLRNDLQLNARASHNNCTEAE